MGVNLFEHRPDLVELARYEAVPTNCNAIFTLAMDLADCDQAHLLELIHKVSPGFQPDMLKNIDPTDTSPKQTPESAAALMAAAAVLKEKVNKMVKEHAVSYSEFTVDPQEIVTKAVQIYNNPINKAQAKGGYCPG